MPLLALLLLTLPASAQSAPEHALRAADVHSRYCADAAGDDIGLAGQSLAVVAETWGALDGVPERGREVGLYYWRGLLAECLNRNDNAIEDLSAFLQLAGNDSLWAQPIRDARRRLGRLLSGSSPKADPADPKRIPGVIAGGALAAGGGVLGALAGVRSKQAQDAETAYYSGTLTTTELAEADGYGSRAVVDANGLLVGGIATGVAGIGTALVSLLLTVPEATPERGPTLSLVVEHDRWTVGVAGRW